MVTSAGGVRHQETEHWLAFVWLPPIVKRRLEYGDETVRAHCQILRSVLEAERLLDPPPPRDKECTALRTTSTHTHTQRNLTAQAKSKVLSGSPVRILLALVMTKTLDSVAIEIGLNF